MRPTPCSADLVECTCEVAQVLGAARQGSAHVLVVLGNHM